MSDVAKKPAWKSPEFMAAMREKGLAKRAETRKIKEAEKMIASNERKAKLAAADKILNPQPDPEPEPVEENVPLPKKTTRKAPASRRELDITDVKLNLASDPPTVSYKEAYYTRKLELLESKKQTPQSPPRVANPAYQLAKQDIAQHVNKSVMDNLWKSYFADSPSPYE